MSPMGLRKKINNSIYDNNKFNTSISSSGQNNSPLNIKKPSPA